MRLLWHAGLIYLCFQVIVSGFADDKIFPEAMRSWKDVDGREIQAVFKGLDGDRVKLEKDGQVYIFSISRLSAADQSYVRNLQPPPSKPLPIAPDASKPPPLSDTELRVAPDVNVALVEQHVVFWVNDARKARNLKPLDSNDRIAQVARSHSMDMAIRGFFAHVNPDGEDAAALRQRRGEVRRAGDAHDADAREGGDERARRPEDDGLGRAEEPRQRALPVHGPALLVHAQGVMRRRGGVAVVAVVVVLLRCGSVHGTMPLLRRALRARGPARRPPRRPGLARPRLGAPLQVL